MTNVPMNTIDESLKRNNMEPKNIQIKLVEVYFYILRFALALYALLIVFNTFSEYDALSAKGHLTWTLIWLALSAAFAVGSFFLYKNIKNRTKSAYAYAILMPLILMDQTDYLVLKIVNLAIALLVAFSTTVKAEFRANEQKISPKLGLKNLKNFHYIFIAVSLLILVLSVKIVESKSINALPEDVQQITNVLLLIAISFFTISWFVPHFKEMRKGIAVDQEGNIHVKDMQVFVFSRFGFILIAISGFLASQLSGSIYHGIFSCLLSLILMITHAPKLR